MFPYSNCSFGLYFCSLLMNSGCLFSHTLSCLFHTLSDERMKDKGNLSEHQQMGIYKSEVVKYSTLVVVAASEIPEKVVKVSCFITV